MKEKYTSLWLVLSASLRLCVFAMYRGSRKRQEQIRAAGPGLAVGGGDEGVAFGEGETDVGAGGEVAVVRKKLSGERFWDAAGAS